MEERGTPSGINRARIHPAREMLAGARLIRCFRGRARDYWHSPWERPSNAPGMQPCARPASTHTAALQSQSDMTMQKPHTRATRWPLARDQISARRVVPMAPPPCFIGAPSHRGVFLLSFHSLTPSPRGWRRRGAPHTDTKPPATQTRGRTPLSGAGDGQVLVAGLLSIAGAVVCVSVVVSKFFGQKKQLPSCV
jgi:hypothetical protein